MTVSGLRDSILIHTSPLFVHALRNYVPDNAGVVICGAYYSWSDFVPARETCPRWVILDAFMDDYVPLLVKVRALHRLGSTPMVLGALNTRQQERLTAAGAAVVISQDLTIPQLAKQMDAVIDGWTPGSTAPVAVDHCNLTDRELQILELYSRRRGLQASVLGPALGLSAGTVRVHLRNARRKLEQIGWPCNSREQLAQALVALGYSLTDQQWKQSGRW